MPLSIGIVACHPTTPTFCRIWPGGGGKSRSDLRTPRTAVNHNQGECVREFLGKFWEKISQVLCFTGCGKLSQENSPATPSKIHRKTRGKIRRKIRQKIRRKIRKKNPPENPPQIPPWKHAPSSTCERLNVVVSLCHSTGLFWVFNKNQTSTFRCKNHSKIKPQISPWPSAEFRVKNFKFCNVCTRKNRLGLQTLTFKFSFAIFDLKTDSGCSTRPILSNLSRPKSKAENCIDSDSSICLTCTNRLSNLNSCNLSRRNDSDCSACPILSNPRRWV